MALDPLNDYAVQEVGTVFYTARQYDEALQEFQKALRLEPDRIDTHVGFGWVYEQQGKYLDSISELEKAVNLSNRDDVPLASLGQVLGEAGRKEEDKKILAKNEVSLATPLHFSLPPCGGSNRAWRTRSSFRVS